MRIVPLALLLAMLSGLTAAAADETVPPEPKLLLTSKLSKRLMRDRERNTPRWVNFENRVKSVPDSSERGFELALYFAITKDASRGHEAVAWAIGHAKETRQRALVLDWCGELATSEERAALSVDSPVLPAMTSFQGRRDCLFSHLASGRDTAMCSGQDLETASLARDGAELYAACEYFFARRMSGEVDQRRQNPQFFQHLPVEFLLARKPQELERPDWLSHAAALALVTLDPNLEASQFLQGWAVEDRHTLHDGPGVAYELLWADPYLPGIAYQNLDPWLYQLETATLLARSDWNADACWVSITTRGMEQQGCPAGWEHQTVNFGTLKLVPSIGKCWDIARQDIRDSIVFWKLKPEEKLVYRDKQEVTARADAAGMWHPGTNVAGKVCTAR